MPGMPRTPSAVEIGAVRGSSLIGPTVPPTIGWPSSTDGAYDFTSFIRPRMYGSSESQMVRTRISPSCGAGTGASTTSKSVGFGSPTGRRMSSTRRLAIARDCRLLARGLQPSGPSAIVRAMTATTRLAEFVVKTSLRECPDAVLAQTRRAALDTIGVMLAGAAEPVAQSVRAVARIEGGVGLCTVLGTSMRTSPGWAALANGAAGHAHDFDDTNFALMGHPSVPLLAAGLAAAE